MAIRRVERQGLASLFNNDVYRAIVRLSGTINEPVSIEYQKYIGQKPVPMILRPSPEHTRVLILDGRSNAENQEEGEKLAKATLVGLAEGSIAYEETPYVTPIKPVEVGRIDHPDKLLQAIILQWPSEYEVRSIGYIPDGDTIPAQGTPCLSFDPDGDWGLLDLLERVLADTYEEAVEAAKAELDRHAASEAPIKLRSEFTA